MKRIVIDEEPTVLLEDVDPDSTIVCVSPWWEEDRYVVLMLACLYKNEIPFFCIDMSGPKMTQMFDVRHVSADDAVRFVKDQESKSEFYEFEDHLEAIRFIEKEATRLNKDLEDRDRVIKRPTTYKVFCGTAQ